MKIRWKCLLRIALIGSAAVLVTGTATWIAAPYCVDDPMIILAKQTPVRTWFDRNGKVLWYERTYDAQWRFFVPLDKVSKHAVRVILATEDASFYDHSGVDIAAVCRAGWQNLTSARRISGASTISMQLAGMALPHGKHDFKRKILQAVMARKLEKVHTKDEILTEYLNRIPFGGKVYGIEAASRYYFGMSADKLNLAESTLLCGLPQKPNFFRPDRHLDRAKERQRIVLKLLVRCGKLAPPEADRILKHNPLRLRDFRYRAAFESLASPGEFFHAFTMSGGQPQTTLDRELHYRMLALLRNQRQHLKDVRDAAALLIDNHSGEVLVYIGTLDFSAKPDGEVDVIRAVRGAGSSLKPFIYAEAVNGGQIVASSKVLDAPIRYGDYSPENYDRVFHGPVSAGFALSNSLNTPAVRLVAILGEARVRETFNRAGLSRFQTNNQISAGLSLALGADGYTLWDITRAYAMLASGGRLFEPALAIDSQHKAAESATFPPEVCTMISGMLRERPFGYSGLDVAWKTGTSNNNCDAWCFAYTPDYTLGIWFGNKDGKRSADLVGAVAAVPVASAIFELLYYGKPQPCWPDESKVLELRELCVESGLTPNAFCTRKNRQTAIPGLPLAVCRSCTPEARPLFRIVSPAPKQYRSPPGKNSVTLKLYTGRKKVSWFLNNRPIEDDLTEYEFPANARYTLRALSDADVPDTPPVSSEVSFSVISNSL